MTGIGGPGGIGGPSGPKGPAGPDALDAPSGPDALDASTEVGDVASVGGTSDIDALAAEVAAGRLTPQEALQQLVDATASPDLGPADRAELRELLADMVANDPYFAALAGRI